MRKQTKITPTILRKRAQRLIATGEMPSPERLLEVIAETRMKYAEKILEVRKVNQRRAQ